MYTPTLDEVKALAGQGNLVPIYREVPADLETPVSAYLKVAQGDHSFLLESVEGGERLARYSFIGTQPYRIVRTGPDEPYEGDPLRLVEDELSRFRYVPVRGLPRFTGGAVGYLAYEVVRYFERLPAPERDPLGLPEAVLMFVDNVLVFDHLTHKIKVVGHVRLDGDIESAYRQATWRIDELVERLNTPLVAIPQVAASGATYTGNHSVRSNIPREDYLDKVERARQYIIDGDIIQVVLSQRFSRRTDAHPFAIYRALRSVNPSPYMYYLALGNCHIVGTSPEMLVRVEDRHIDYHPIAGTRRRGGTPEEDLALEEELRNDEKERAEHIMLLDLGRNDVGRVSVPGSVRVPQILEIERYSHVMHLVSHVTGELRPDLTPYDALRACFPAGTVAGAPKIRAMEIIAELEPDRRGPYAGAVGYFSYTGDMDTCITIRTILLKDGMAHVQAGAGIVADSQPEREYQECLNKARAALYAIELAHRGLD